jgi:RNA polymerase sigma factor (sigma-70 family)
VEVRLISDSGIPNALPGSFPPEENPADQEIHELVKRYRVPIYRFVVRRIGKNEDAVDLTQQVFTEASIAISYFRGQSKLSTWLFGIATNLTLNYLNRSPHRVHRFVSDDLLHEVAAAASDPSERVSAWQEMTRIINVLDTLPPTSRDVFIKIAIEGESYESVAAAFSIPVGTVRSKVSRTRTLLRVLLDTREIGKCSDRPNPTSNAE